MTPNSGKAPNPRETFNPKSIAYECLRLFSERGPAAGIAPDATAPKHVQRVVARLELASLQDPEKIEEVLQSLLPAPEWEELRARLGELGAKICIPRDPKCESCPLSSVCPTSREVT